MHEMRLCQRKVPHNNNILPSLHPLTHVPSEFRWMCLFETEFCVWEAQTGWWTLLKAIRLTNIYLFLVEQNWPLAYSLKKEKRLRLKVKVEEQYSLNKDTIQKWHPQCKHNLHIWHNGHCVSCLVFQWEVSMLNFIWLPGKSVEWVI